MLNLADEPGTTQERAGTNGTFAAHLRSASVPHSAMNGKGERMETTELIERVARAMAAKSKARVAGINFIHSMTMDGEENFMELARAAIEEMRKEAVFQGELPDGAVIERNQFTGDLSELIRRGVLVPEDTRYGVSFDWPAEIKP